MNKKLYISTLAITAILAGASVATSVYAESDNSQSNQPHPMMKANFNGNVRKGMMDNMRPAVVGTITAINGTTLTVTGRNFGTTTATTTYTVNAASTTIMRADAKITVSGLVVGDMVMVRGTTNGTVITASDIRTGIMKGIEKRMEDRKDGTSTPMMDGNGQPIVGGTVSAVTGSTITITNKSNVTYTIDATTATVTIKGKTGVIGDIKVGDSILTQGTVNGTSVVAVSVNDQGAIPVPKDNGKGPQGGFFGRIGNFFAHLFGF